jgi:hypothetical protein
VPRRAGYEWEQTGMGRKKASGVRVRYRIVVRGEFGELLSTAFADVTIETGEGKTMLISEVRDSQELYGLVDRLRDHGVHIESVSQDDVSD